MAVVSFIKDKYHKAVDKRFKINFKDIGKRRVLAIICEFCMISLPWSLYYFSCFKGLFGTLSALKDEHLLGVIVTYIILFGIYVLSEFFVFVISRAFINFVFVGEYVLDDSKVTQFKKRGKK